MERNVHCWRTKVLFGDIDYFGVVFYLKYFDWCTQAREHFILSHHPEELNTVCPSVIEVSHKFHHAARLNDDIHIEISFHEIKRTSVWMYFQIHRLTGEHTQLIGTHRQRILFLTRDGKITRMSSALFSTLQRYACRAFEGTTRDERSLGLHRHRNLLSVTPVTEPF